MKRISSAWFSELRPFSTPVRLGTQTNCLVVYIYIYIVRGRRKLPLIVSYLLGRVDAFAVQDGRKNTTTIVFSGTPHYHTAASPPPPRCYGIYIYPLYPSARHTWLVSHKNVFGPPPPPHYLLRQTLSVTSLLEVTVQAVVAMVYKRRLLLNGLLGDAAVSGGVINACEIRRWWRPNAGGAKSIGNRICFLLGILYFIIVFYPTTRFSFSFVS